MGSTRRVVRLTSCARGLFQLGQVIAHIGARHLELARCLAEIAAINDFDQQGQRLGVHGVFV